MNRYCRKKVVDLYVVGTTSESVRAIRTLYKCTQNVQKMSKKRKNAQYFEKIVHFYLLFIVRYVNI